MLYAELRDAKEIGQHGQLQHQLGRSQRMRRAM